MVLLSRCRYEFVNPSTTFGGPPPLTQGRLFIRIEIATAKAFAVAKCTQRNDIQPFDNIGASKTKKGNI